MDGTTDVIKAFDIRDNLFERTLTANVLRHRPNGVPTDGSLNDGRTVIGIGLEGRPRMPAPTESARVATVPATMPRREGFSGRRGGAGGRRKAGSSARCAAMRRRTDGADAMARTGARGAGDGRRGRVRDTHDNLQTTVSNTCSSNTCTIACTAANVETHSNICFILRVIGLKLTHPVDGHPCTSASTPTKEGP